MADLGFPLNPELSRGIAQYMINGRQMVQRGQGGGVLQVLNQLLSTLDWIGKDVFNNRG